MPRCTLPRAAGETEKPFAEASAPLPVVAESPYCPAFAKPPLWGYVWQESAFSTNTAGSQRAKLCGAGERETLAICRPQPPTRSGMRYIRARGMRK